jgi:hypothetical protein
MTQLDDVRSLLDQPGRDLNEAARDYAEHGTNVPAAIKAEPVLYGELARGALQWTADLLTAIEQCAATRPAAEAALGPLVDSVVAYFADSPRWPPVAHLGHPLLLLVPAYYAAHGVHLLDYHVQPPLLHVEFDEPHAFMEEVLGRGPSMTIRQHKNADLSSMPKVVEDAPGYEPPVFRSFLSSRQRARLAEARAARLAPTVGVTPEPSPASVEPGVAGAQDDVDSIVAAMWTGRLRDTRITLRAESSFDAGYGGSSFFSAETTLDLLDGGTYRLRETVITQISSSGLMIGGEPRTTESSGDWSVSVSGDSNQLRLDDEGGAVTRYSLAEAGSGSIEVDGEVRGWTRL